ncbi:hypothetical protein CPC08DRAFT_706408 [Agrocybe pediades]|nr:hypothetical protein CPC08DRAFT_706408 [Agrocybe pediades]
MDATFRPRMRTPLSARSRARMTPATRDKLEQAYQDLSLLISSGFPTAESTSANVNADLRSRSASRFSNVSRGSSTAHSGLQHPLVPGTPLSIYSTDFSDGQTVIEEEGDDYFDSESVGTSSQFFDFQKSFSKTTYDDEPWKVGDDFNFPIVAPKGGHWQVAYNFTRKEDQAMCAIWKEDIDKLLVFAGLFAATVVAFLIVSYQLLQPAAGDMRNAMQATLLTLLKEPNNGVDRNALLEAVDASLQADKFSPPPSVLRMNVAWFLSMTLSLSTVLVGTVCLQWIREYQRETRLGPKQAFALRQMRYDGLEYWRVPLICSLLSLFLQAALLLFFWGLIEFLRSLNAAIAVINAVVIGIVALFMAAAVVSPAFQCIFSNVDKPFGHQCAYKSPQSRVFSVFAFWATIHLIKILRWLIRDPSYLEKKRTFLAAMLAATEGWNWVSFDNEWQQSRMMDISSRHGSVTQESRDIPQALAWLGKTFSNDYEAIGALYHAARSLHPSTTFQTLKALGGEYEGLFDFKPSAHGGDEILSDLQSAFLLRDLVDRNSKLQSEAVLFHRLELLIRIANHTAAEKAQYISPEVRVLIERCFEGKGRSINPFKEDQDYSVLPDYVVRQVLTAFQRYLRVIKTDTKFPYDLWKAVGPMVYQVVHEKIRRSDITLEEEFALLNKELEEYIDRVDHRALPSQTYQRFRNYVNQFKDHLLCVDQQEEGSIYISFLNSLRSLDRRVHIRPVLEPPPSKITSKNVIPSL